MINQLHEKEKLLLLNTLLEKFISETDVFETKKRYGKAMNDREKYVSIYESISEVGRTLKISRKKITFILDTGLVYKNNIFNLYK